MAPTTVTTLPLALACWDYDRTKALRDGVVRPSGIDLTYVEIPAVETFYRMVRFREFDVAEMSLSSYVRSLLLDAPFMAIPVFVSRAFRHNSIYVHANGPVREPADLAGAVVGIPEYQVTAAVWIRGILATHHGVPVESVRYRIGGLHHPGRVEKLPIALPDSIDYATIPPDRTLDEMLVTGEIDALYSPRTPDSFRLRRPEVRRLFGDPKSAERAYFEQTGIFPPMHTVVVRRDVYERHPWVASSLFTAFADAKAAAADRLEQSAALVDMLPWLYADVEEAQAVMGHDYWPYGLEANRATLDVFLDYMQAQGLTERRLAVDELFAAETKDFVVV